MQIPILNGIYTDSAAGIRTSYPVNLIPVPKDSGISQGFLRPGDGVVQNGTGPGSDRGGINWKNVCYRVMGTKLVSITSGGAVTVLGDVGGSLTQLVTFDYGFDRLAIASGGNLYYWDGGTLTQVTDPDIGTVVDVLWVDGYFMTTDGTNIVVTELNDPLAVNPLKYGSSEADPDAIKAIVKIRNEPYVLNRYTTEVFSNVGGDFFPFQRIESAQIQKGTMGTHTCCVMMDTLAFLGSGRNEAPAVYIGSNATATKISTREIDELLAQYTEEELIVSKLEVKVDKAHQHLYVHLMDRTLVYDATASQIIQEPIWFTLTTSTAGFSKYRARNLVWCYDKWLAGDPLSSNVGYLTHNVSSHWGQQVRWEFGTVIVYNESRGAIFNALELVAITGHINVADNPYISTSYSVDGLSWSQPRSILSGKHGNTQRRLLWLQQGHMRHWRIQRFCGDSQSHLSFARLEAQLEPLMV